MEEDDNNKKIEDEGTNRLIHDTFARTEQDKFHDIHDVPLLNKASQPLYEVSRANILSTTLLLANLKMLNGLSNTCMTHILRYVHHIYIKFYFVLYFYP